MENKKKYDIVISSGNLDDDYLIAEIYLAENVFIGSVSSTGKDILFDFTCQTGNEVCKGERKIPAADFISAVNDALHELELHFYLKMSRKA
jgi:hypothetical protein